MNDLKIELLLKNFPKTNLKELPKGFEELIDFKGKIHFITKELSYRKFAKDLSILLVTNYLKVSNVKCAPIYINKFEFIEEWKKYLFLKREDVIDKWKGSSFLVFDGIDDVSSVSEMSYIASFLIGELQKEKPIVLISGGKLKDNLLDSYNAMSFGVALYEVRMWDIGR